MKNSAKYIYLTIPNEDFPKIVIKIKRKLMEPFILARFQV